MKTPEQITKDVLDQVCVSDIAEIAHISQVHDIIERAIQIDRAQRDIGDYSRGLTVEMLGHLIRQMIDGATLTQLDEEEIADLATRAEDGLVPYIVEVDEYEGL